MDLREVLARIQSSKAAAQQSIKNRIENIQEDVIANHKQVIDYINNRDWGMAEFYTSDMVHSIAEFEGIISDLMTK